MKIYVRYENKITVYDIPKEELELMVERDYQIRLNEASPSEKGRIRRRTPQEIFNELNNKELNNLRKFNALVDSYPNNKVKRLGTVICSNPDVENGSSSSVDIVDPYIFENHLFEYEDTCNFIRSVLKPKQADLFIDVVLNQVPIKEIADREGVTSQAISHRLETARNNLKIFLENPHI